MDKIDGDMFHALAFQAFIIEARKVGGWPESEKVRELACRLYEDVLEEVNG